MPFPTTLNNTLRDVSFLLFFLLLFIAKSAVGPCASVQVTDKSVFLWNDNYPNTIQSNHDGCSCSIETSCDSRIQITALDVRLLETDGTCQQSFILNDEGQTTHLGCDTNNNYRAKTVYTSTSQFLVLELRNVASNNDGNFWFQITGMIKRWSGSNWFFSNWRVFFFFFFFFFQKRDLLFMQSVCPSTVNSLGGI